MVSSRRLAAGQGNGNVTNAEVHKARTSVKIDQGLIIVLSLCLLSLTSYSSNINIARIGHLDFQLSRNKFQPCLHFPLMIQQGKNIDGEEFSPLGDEFASTQWTLTEVC